MCGAFSGPALTHGFQIAFYVLAAIALAGAVLSALMLESRPGAAEAEIAADEATPALEAA